MRIKEVSAAIPLVNPERAKRFYSEVLGFEIETLNLPHHMYWAHSPNGKFLLYQREESSKADHTVLTISIEDIAEAILTLEERGVKFYEDNGQKIFQLGNSQSAWFNDSEGNYLEISQRVWTA